MLPAQPNQSLIDGLTVLQAVIARRRQVGSRELARELDLDPTRVNRLLKTLAHLGLTEQGDDRRYRPGPAIHVLAAQSLFGSGLIRRAIPHLEALHRHGLVVAMGVLWRDQVSYLYHALPGMNAGDALGRAGLFPAARSGIGVVLMARLDEEQWAPSVSRGELEAARRQGYALIDTRADRGEPVHSLAVPLPGDAATAIALSGVIPAHAVPALADDLRRAADAITTPAQGNAP